MFIAGAIVGGIIVAYDDHSRYSDYDDYSDHSKYGDANMVNAINQKQKEIDRKADDVENLRDHMEYNFRNRIAELKREKNYKGLDYKPDYIIFKVKNEMVAELEGEIQREKEALAEIDKMIAKINELELQAGR